MNDMEWDFGGMEPAPDAVTPLARIRWGVHRFRIISADEERFQLVCSDGTGTRRELERAEVCHLVATKEIVIEHGHFNVDGTVAPKRLDGLFASYPLKKQVDALDNLEWVKELQCDYDAGRVKLYSDPRSILPNGAVPLNHWIAQKTPIIRERMRAVRRIADPILPKRPRKGQPTNEVDPPGITQLKANFAKFRAPGFDVVQFIDGYGNCGSGSKLAPHTQSVMTDVCNELYARNTRFAPAQLQAHIAAELTVKAQKTVKGPCHETIARFLSTLDQGRLMLARFGFKKARETKGSNAKGPKYTRVGEMVLMDCWKIDLVSLLKRTGIWMHMSRPEKKAWGQRRRIWVCVAIDAATRVVLGMAFGLAESPALSRRVLRMIVSDKTDEAEATGALSPPPPAIGIECLRTDSGIAFRHGYFVASALSLVDHLKVGIVGKPWRNGLMERFFRTSKEQLLPYFGGLTFGNPQARGDFDAMADASATLDVFGDAMFRFFNDVHRLRPHRGLDKQPPLNRWEETLVATGMKKPPSEDHQIVAFGLEEELLLTPQGLTHAGVEYKAAWLSKLFGARTETWMRVKIDPCNLGRIAVMWDGAWQIVDGPPEFNGVGLTVLQRTKQALGRRYGEQAAVNFPIVAQTLLDIRDMGARERVAAKMMDMTYDNQKLKDQAKTLQLQVIYRPTPAQHNAPRAVSKGAFGNAFATGQMGDAEVSGEGGELFDPDTDLPEVKIVDPLAEPTADDAGDVYDDEADGDDDTDEDEAQVGEQPPQPAKPRKGRAPPSTGLVMTTLADLKKGNI
ncbi:DDE-type integrase/transposase/recombinase [Devosia sp. 1635]|uniref:DDE-type integrase/transposase/recombinase n=1 Tax=Devosia sp. 1635 TaxID=2726066 RepID=UPI001563BCD1|nr:DDE-type integrase/transposase/recombinase [Devosia sp. 1635]